METEKWIDESLQTNIQMYYTARFTFDRYHYSNIYTYAKAIMTYVPVAEDRLENKTRLIGRITEFHENPLKYYYDEIKKEPFYKKKFPNVSFSRLEYIIFKYTGLAIRGAVNLSRPIYLSSNKDLELGEILDIMELFKGSIHEWLVAFMVENKVGVNIEMPNIGLMGISQVGFGVKTN